MSLVDERSCGYVVHRSNAAPAALSASWTFPPLNLAVLQGPAIFLLRGTARLEGIIAQLTPAYHEGLLGVCLRLPAAYSAPLHKRAGGV
jgi:hypothetical protein